MIWQDQAGRTHTLELLGKERTLARQNGELHLLGCLLGSLPKGDARRCRKAIRTAGDWKASGCASVPPGRWQRFSFAPVTVQMEES